jgi:hypothetical protein
MIHQTYLEGYQKDFEDLIKEINQDYTHALIFINHLADNLSQQAEEDFLRGRKKLSFRLSNAAI